MADYPGAIDCFVDPSRVFVGQNSCEVIVLHGTGGANPDQTVQELGAYFASTPERTSVHYGIDRTGVVAQYVHEADGAGGNCCSEPGYDPFWQPYLTKYGNLNLCTLSIEHENNDTNSLPLTDAQKQTSFKLVAYLCQKYHLDSSHIKTHASIAPIDRAHCPGNYPFNDLQIYLQQGGSMSGVPQGWTDNNNVLTAPNGIQITQGFRQFVLTNTWDPANWPLQPAQGMAQLEVSNPALGGGTQQIFNWTVLEWTQSAGVFVAWAGKEVLALRGVIANYANQVKSLQAQLLQANNTALVNDLQTRLNRILQIANPNNPIN